MRAHSAHPHPAQLHAVRAAPALSAHARSRPAFSLCMQGSRLSTSVPWPARERRVAARQALAERRGAVHRHTSRFLTIWLLFLPLTLWPTARWSTIPASAIIAFLLLDTPVQ